jgi:hypothetical protein
LKAHSSATQLKKGEKMAKKSRFLAKQPNRKQALKYILRVAKFMSGFMTEPEFRLHEFMHNPEGFREEA